MNAATQFATQLAVQAAAADERILKTLREAGAHSDHSAVAIAPGSSFDQRRLESLGRTGAIVEVSSGLYYVDERVIAARNERTRQILTRVMAGLAAALLLAITAGLVAG